MPSGSGLCCRSCTASSPPCALLTAATPSLSPLPPDYYTAFALCSLLQLQSAQLVWPHSTPQNLGLNCSCITLTPADTPTHTPHIP